MKRLVTCALLVLVVAAIDQAEAADDCRPDGLRAGKLPGGAIVNWRGIDDKGDSELRVVTIHESRSGHTVLMSDGRVIPLSRLDPKLRLPIEEALRKHEALKMLQEVLATVIDKYPDTPAADLATKTQSEIDQARSQPPKRSQRPAVP